MIKTRLLAGFLRLFWRSACAQQNHCASDQVGTSKSALGFIANKGLQSVQEAYFQPLRFQFIEVGDVAMVTARQLLYVGIVMRKKAKS